MAVYLYLKQTLENGHLCDIHLISTSIQGLFDRYPTIQKAIRTPYWAKMTTILHYIDMLIQDIPTFIRHQNAVINLGPDSIYQYGS